MVTSKKMQNIDIMRELGKKYKRFGLNGIPSEDLIYHERTMMSESDGDQTSHVKPKVGTSGGLYGITEPTWKDLVSKNPELKIDGRFDVKQHITGHFDLSYENKEKLIKAFGEAPDLGSWYSAHFLGAGGVGAKVGTKGIGAIDVIKEAKIRPNTPIKGFLSQDKIDANKDVKLKLDNGNYLNFEDFAVGDFLNLCYSKMGMKPKYPTNSVGSYSKDKHGIPESMGNLVMVAIVAAVAIVAFVASGIGDMFSSDDKSPSPTPSRPRVRSRA